MAEYVTMTKQNEKKYRPPVMKRIGGVLLLAVGLFIFTAMLYYAAQDFPLWIFGRHTQAEVVETWVERTDNIQEGEGGEFTFDFYLRYQFATSDGQIITKTSKASAIEWSGMGKGQSIDILYFPLYPNLNRLDNSRWVFFLSCTYLPLIVISLIGLRVGWYMLTSP